MKKIVVSLFILFALANIATAQEYFTIRQYDVTVHVNKDASLDVDETINVHFTEARHGIIRAIPFRYKLQSLPEGAEKADRQLESGRYSHTIIENVKVDGWDYEVSTDGDYKSIKIGSADKVVDGDQQYVIHYRMLNAINFFKDHAELYFNIIGDKWETTIDSVNFTVSLYDTLPGTPDYFVATGATGSQRNNTVSNWTDNKILTGHTTTVLVYHEGLTVGIGLPKDFLTEQDYSLLGIAWMILPLGVFIGMFLIWKKWGKDEKPTVQTEFYPPENVSPSISGYVIDDTLNRRDLTALVPYWGAGGYLKIEETEKSSLLGLIKDKEYTFIKLKELPATAKDFEQTLFNGIFASGDNVKLSSLKNVLYKSMNTAKSQVEAEIKRDEYYVKGSATTGCLFMVFSLAFIVYGGAVLFGALEGYAWTGVAFLSSGIIIMFFGIFMRKKTRKGTDLYQKLLGFKEFLKAVEKDRLKEFLKQDEHYFDKILPYAIVFGIADTWKDKLEGLDIPPPNWYVGNYTTFNTVMFMSSLNNSMNQMSSTFYSSPGSSGSSGGSFSGGGGFSGGGFGGGGGSSW
ncbi:DUF2207 domain-containing protein [Panacibacter ginsenosidivorans]|uniref:DUF2207 domain-containing protein n=1 Tax=Panacibacter ginsenosidivorans TaxID=1813871 RepID=UPI0013153B1C|nr:DUF2207 domain-containing protein [Panacibacter ginsenosidivorans]